MFNSDKHESPFRDAEIELVERLIDTVTVTESLTDAVPIIDFYVAVKSKPLLILTGDLPGDKTILVRALAQVLLGADQLQSQVLMGQGTHGASGSLTMLHARFVTEKILAALEEASLPENSDRMYIVCLSQISPAELSSCFDEVAYQLSHGVLMRIGDVHFSKPLRYPDNLWLIGTIDDPQIALEAENLASQAMIFRPPAVDLNSSSTFSEKENTRFQTVFLKSRIRRRQAAYRKLQLVLGDHGTNLESILKVVQCLNRHGLSVPSTVFDYCIIYLANAWSSQGQGLFDPVTCRNLEIASDLVIAQMLHSNADRRIRTSQSLRLELHGLLRSFPHSLAFLKHSEQLSQAL